MPTTSEYNQFRRYIGDYGNNVVDNTTIDAYLNDAALDLTADFEVPIATFDSLVRQYHPEVITWAAINWWWNVASKLVDHHSQQLGAGSHQASEKWERAMQMIEYLTTRFESIQTLGADVSIGNLSRFSKLTLTRFGGRSEEDALESWN